MRKVRRSPHWTCDIEATPQEISAALPGDDLVERRDAVMDRAFTLDAPPAEVWPWLVQLGKGRAGWYLPRSLERLVPPGHRAERRIDPRWQDLHPGDVVPDYGGRHETFTVERIEPCATLVYTSRRSAMQVSWAMSLTPVDLPANADATRVHLRLTLGPVRRRWLVATAGELVDVLTIAGMVRGLRERLEQR